MGRFKDKSLEELLDLKIFLLKMRNAIELSSSLSSISNVNRFYKYISMFSSKENWESDFDAIISIFDDEIKNRVQHMSLDELSFYHEQLYNKNNEIVDSLINDSFESGDFYYYFSEGQCYVDLDKEILSTISSKNKIKKL